MSSLAAVIRTFLPPSVRRPLARARVRAAARIRSRDLTRLAQLFGTDKWGTHWYTPHYQRHLQARRNQPVTLLEIGIGGYEEEGVGGESLRTWKYFFPNGKIAGIDLQPKKWVEEARITTFQGSQDDEHFLKSVVGEIGRPDIVIDDGSHLNHHVLRTFEVLFPLLADDGIYAIEDTQTAYWPSWGGEATERNAPTTSTGFFKALTDGLNHSEYLGPQIGPSYYDRHIVGISFYHNLIIIQKGPNIETSNMVTDGVLRVD